jgi:hypothetical protein
MLETKDIRFNSYVVPPDGTLAPGYIPGQQSIGSFQVGSDGRLTYFVGGLPITALTGTLFVGTSARTLTHVSSGVATISGAQILNSDTSLRVTIASTVPATTSIVTNVTVTNNVPAPLPLAKRSLTYNAPAVKTGDSFTLLATDAGFDVNNTIDTTKDFELFFSGLSEAGVISFTPTRISGAAWQASAVTAVAAFYYDSGNLSTGKGGVYTIAEALPRASTTLRVKKSGDNIILSKLVASAYVEIRTFTGALTGNPLLYLKFINAGGGASTGTITAFE